MRNGFYFDKSVSHLLEKLEDFSSMMELYEKGEVIPSGRGTARIIELEGVRFILKKEARGGFLAKFLPDRFFFMDRFDREWLIQGLADSLRLSPPLLARWEIAKNILLKEIYTLTAYIENCPSLRDLVADGGVPPGRIMEAGKLVAALHNNGLFHGDLNCGNILFTSDGARAIDLKGSYIFSAPLPEELSKRNLRRLFRSFYKETLRSGKPADIPFIPLLLEGYRQARDEEWVRVFSKTAAVSAVRMISYRFKC